MKVVIIGLGSMGQRRLRLIKKYDERIQILGVVRSAEKRDALVASLGIECYESLENAIASHGDIVCAFVCSGPLSHTKIIKTALENNINVFTEINLVDDGYAENLALAKEKGLKMFLSSTFLYRAEIKYIKNRIDENNKKLNYIYHVGQYLPNWHPWEDYRKVFFADVRTNGVREEMAVDFPWLFYLFGKVKSYRYLRDRNTELDLAMEYKDNCMLIAEHENGNKGVLVFDVVSPKAERFLEIYGENFFISWDGSATGLNELLSKAKECENPNKIPLTNIDLYANKGINLQDYATFVVEDAYFNEIVAFFDYVKTGKAPVYTFEDDYATINLINEIESAEKGGNL